MSTTNLIALKRCGYNIFAYGLPNTATNICLAYGTRFIQHIPTQELIPSALAGTIFTVTCALVSAMMTVKSKTINDSLKQYYPDTDKRNSALPKIYIITQLSLATLVTTIGTRAVASFAGGLISYNAAAGFALINCFSTLAVSKFLVHYKLTANQVFKS